MKFIDAHYQDILNCFAKHKFTKDDFYFVKKKGRIITHHRHSNHTFSYILKKDIHLNEKTHEFEDVRYFEISEDALQKEKISTWDGVIVKYNKWLKTLLR